MFTHRFSWELIHSLDATVSDQGDTLGPCSGFVFLSFALHGFSFFNSSLVKFLHMFAISRSQPGLPKLGKKVRSIKFQSNSTPVITRSECQLLLPDGF